MFLSKRSINRAFSKRNVGGFLVKGGHSVEQVATPVGGALSLIGNFVPEVKLLGQGANILAFAGRLGGRVGEHMLDQVRERDFKRNNLGY